MTTKPLDTSPGRDPRTYRIIGCALQVHRHLGCGFLERVYHAAFERELMEEAIPFVREPAIPILYKGRRLPLGYHADFVCFDEILVELKAEERLTDRHESQVINYLAAGAFSCGLLMNFGATSLQFQRLVFTKKRGAAPEGG